MYSDNGLSCAYHQLNRKEEKNVGKEIQIVAYERVIFDLVIRSIESILNYTISKYEYDWSFMIIRFTFYSVFIIFNQLTMLEWSFIVQNVHGAMNCWWIARARATESE